MSALDASREALASILRDRSVEVGTFTLSSGKNSHYYVDARRTTMSAEGLELVGRIGVEMISAAGWQATVIGGLTLGADPVAYAIAQASRRAPPVMDGFTVRKEAKAHGAGRLIEGCFSPGDRAVVVEDVITTGRSALNAAEAVVAAGGHVVGVLAVVDRMDGGRDAIEEAGFPVAVMFTIQDLGVDPSAS